MDSKTKAEWKAWGAANTLETKMEIVKDMIAFIQNGREVKFKEVTTQDLLADALTYDSEPAKVELARRGIDWSKYR